MSHGRIENYFVCVGAQKAGTTWLARMLAHHPDLFVTPVKEIHFFDHQAGLCQKLSRYKRYSRYRKYLQRMVAQPSNFAEHKSQWAWYQDYACGPIDDDWYVRLFAHRGQARFAGEATPDYAVMSPELLGRIKALAPDARVIYIMRNPVTRSWSKYLHFCRKHKLDAAAQPLAEIVEMLQSDEFSLFADDEAVINNLHELFGRSQVHLDFYEDIHADREAALKRICGFIGVAEDLRGFPDLGQRHNSSQKAAMPAGVQEHLRRQYRPMAQRLADGLGELPPAWREEFSL